MAKILVTGGAGFIGSNLVNRLVKQNHDVKIIDNFTRGKMSNISHLKNKIKIIKGDIRNIKTIKECVKDVDYIFHEAACVSVSESIKYPMMINDVNINGTLNILIAARDSNIKKVIYASTCAVYGNVKKIPIKEDSNTDPLSIYALTKFFGEEYCKIFYKLYGINIVILRYFNVYGPKQSYNSSPYTAVIPNFITKMLNGEQPTIYGDGEQARDFVFIEDIVDANILAMNVKKINGEVFNIGSGTSTTINELVKKISSLLNIEVIPNYIPSNKGDIRLSLADIQKAKEILGFEPKYDLMKGLNETIRWLKQEKSCMDGRHEKHL